MKGKKPLLWIPRGRCWLGSCAVTGQGRDPRLTGRLGASWGCAGCSAEAASAAAGDELASEARGAQTARTGRAEAGAEAPGPRAYLGGAVGPRLQQRAQRLPAPANKQKQDIVGVNQEGVYLDLETGRD